MAIGDIYQLTHMYRDFDNKQDVNVYFYRQDANPAAALPAYSQQLAEMWNQDVLTPMLATWTADWVSYGINVRNLFDPGDVYEMPINRAGSRAAATEALPSLNSVKATYATSNGYVNKGRKSFAGLIEGDQNRGLLTLAGLTNFATRTALTTLKLVGAVVAGYAFAPVIVKRVRSGTPGNYTYRLPVTPAEVIFGYVTSAILSAVTSSQVTRKD